MPSHTRLHVSLKISAAVTIMIAALIIGARFETPARATGNGPTLTLSGPGVVPPGGAFDLVFKSSGAVPNAYAGYGLVFTYDPTLVSFTSVTDGSTPSLWATDFCAGPLSNVDLGPALTPPPLRAYIYGCSSLGVGTSSVGTLATVHAQALATGTLNFHMLTLSAPDNSSPFSTYTIDDIDRQGAQTNALACSGSCSGADVVVLVPGTGSISGKVYHDNVSPANALGGVVVNICPTGGGACGSAYTDATGAYTARFAGNGTYNVTALPSNPFLTATIGPVTVTGGVNTPGQDVIMPSPPGAISGHIYLNVAGAGNELIGTTVGACPVAGGECRTAVSDGTGLYNILYLVDGSYNVTAVAPGSFVLATIGPITVAGGVVSGQDIVVLHPSGGISGHVYSTSIAPANAVPGAQVSACPTVGSTPCRFAVTDALGAYILNFLDNGSYIVVASPPVLNLPSAIPVTVAGGVVTTGQNVVVNGGLPISPGTTLSPTVVLLGGVPAVLPSAPLTITRIGCAGGTASYQLLYNTTMLSSGAMAEGPPGTYTISIPALGSLWIPPLVVTSLDCGGGPIISAFNIYIDPSGSVKTQAGAPIAGATVTLLRSDSPFGPFAVVPNGSDVMELDNRKNPDTTDSTGHFGWNVTAGYYRVHASKPGCVAAADPSVQVLTWRAFAQSALLKIPPAVTDLDLRMICDDTDQDGYTNKVEILRGDHPTIYCQTMRSDIDDDGVVSILDLSKAAAFFGQSTTTAPPRYDQGPPPFDGSISILDFSKMASVFGKSVNNCP